MARPIEEFAVAWQALSGNDGEEGWRCISVSPAGKCPILAARRFPGNEEAMLAGFLTAKAPPMETLPEGVGFEVAREDPYGDGKTWIALTRKDSGSDKIFAEMVSDVAGAMDVVSESSEEAVMRSMLSRIRAWQEFMRKMPRGLAPEAEVGLAGELQFLAMLLDAGMPSDSAVGSWLGPIGGLQDFEIGTGAVEVKSTLSSRGFPAKIGSMEQLDDSFRTPMFLAGIRFFERSSGFNLGEIAEKILERIGHHPGAAADFADRLVAAGFPAAHFDKYSRRFAFESMRVLEVGDDFPRFVPGKVPEPITKVRYELDLDKVPGSGIRLVEALERLGVA